MNDLHIRKLPGMTSLCGAPLTLADSWYYPRHSLPPSEDAILQMEPTKPTSLFGIRGQHNPIKDPPVCEPCWFEILLMIRRQRAEKLALAGKQWQTAADKKWGGKF